MKTLPDNCPYCGDIKSYTNGYCFKCGKYRPGKRGSGDEKDCVDFMNSSLRNRLKTFRLQAYGERIYGDERDG